MFLHNPYSSIVAHLQQNRRYDNTVITNRLIVIDNATAEDHSNIFHIILGLLWNKCKFSFDLNKPVMFERSHTHLNANLRIKSFLL